MITRNSLETYFDLETNLGRVRVAAWVFPPRGDNTGIWMLCIPGATYLGNSYWNMHVPELPDTYSMVDAMAEQGIGSIVIDNLGTGKSLVPFSEMSLTADFFASTYSKLVQQMKERLITGTLVDGLRAVSKNSLWTIGVGHSMGGFILVHTQGSYHPFDSVAVLGFPTQEENVAVTMAAFGGENALQTFGEIAEQYQGKGDEGKAELRKMMRQMLRPLFYSSDVPQELIRVDEEKATDVPLGLFQGINDFKQIREAAARITAPLYIGTAELEMPFPLKEAASYPATDEVRLFRLKGAAHCAYFSKNRRLSWVDIISWSKTTATNARLSM